jgi:hypothetical protein
MSLWIELGQLLGFRQMFLASSGKSHALRSRSTTLQPTIYVARYGLSGTVHKSTGLIMTISLLNN